MPTIHLTDAQHEQFESLRTSLEDTYAGEYASVTEEDVIAYLLDLAASMDEPGTLTGDAVPDDQESRRDTADSADTEPDIEQPDMEPVTEGADNPDGPRDAPGASAGAGQLNAMLNLLQTHDDKWTTGEGDTRYEVSLPDGSVEPARTKDDVRALLFKHYR